MKKNFLSIVFALMFILLSTAVAYANDNIKVTVEGQRITFANQPPVVFEGRTLVPVRGVFEHMGFDVGWDATTRRVTLTNSQHAVMLTVGSNEFTNNGVSRTLDIPPQIINGTTMLPIRSVLESVGYQLDWDSHTSTVIITAFPIQSSSAPVSVVSQTAQTQQQNASGWRTINGPYGLSLNAPSSWEHDETDRRQIRLIIEEGIHITAALSDGAEAYYNRFIDETSPQFHLSQSHRTSDSRESFEQFINEFINAGGYVRMPELRVVSHDSFLFDDGTVGLVAENEQGIVWISENASVHFFFTAVGGIETDFIYTYDKTFFYENEEAITRAVRSLTVTE